MAGVARPGTARSQAQQGCADGFPKPTFYDAGRILGKTSRLYGYSFLHAGICSVFVSGVSSLPLTAWDDEGHVPKANVTLVSLFLFLWFAITVSLREE